jgi:hypothetical protein
MDHLHNFVYTLYNGITEKLSIPKQHLLRAAKWLYWIIGLVLLVGTCYVLYNRFQKPVAAVLLFMGGWTMLMYYWVKWFKLTEKNPDWPPFITPCPDFLTLYPDGNVAKCVDFVGVARMNAMKPIKRSSPTDIKATINNEDYFVIFKLPDSDDSNFKKLNMELCDRVHERGLVWSGVCEER